VIYVVKFASFDQVYTSSSAPQCERIGPRINQRTIRSWNLQLACFEVEHTLSPVSGGRQAGTVHGRREETPEGRAGVLAPFSDNEPANGRDRTRDADSTEDDEGR